MATYKLRIKYGDTVLINSAINDGITKIVNGKNKLFLNNTSIEIYNAGRLPDGYTEVEYLESTGAQYINTGIKCLTTVTGSLKFQLTDTSSNNWILGAVDGSWRGMEGGSYEGSMYTVQGVSYDSTTPSTNLNNLTFKVINSTATTLNIYIFSRNANGSTTASGVGKMKIYNCKLYNSGTLVRDFVPCKNNSNIGGMYDLVSNTFFANAGSDTFIIGPEVIY